MGSVRGTAFRVALLVAAVAAPATAQEPTPVRLRDAVGDTIDAAERNSFHLFPSTAMFRQAVILALPGPEFYAEITRTGADSIGHIFLRIMPNDLERIRFLIDNREYIAAQQRSDSAYARALASFWQEMEKHPLRNMAGEPAIAPEVPPAPTEAGTAGEPRSESAAVVVRPSDAAGDTIDAAERDRFRLFPNTTGFRHAVFLALPGRESFAEVTRADGDTVIQVYYRILPGQLERIRFLIDNREYVAAQQRSDSTYAQALASFWQTIEDSPLRNMASEPAIAEVPPAPAEAPTAGEPGSEPVTSENRYNYTLHGTALGSAAGGLLGSAGSRWAYGVWPPLSQPVFLTVACGATALGSYAGYKEGEKLDRKALSSQPLRSEGTGWRTCCTLGACVPGLTLGVVTAAYVGAAANGGDLTWIPAILSGLCVTVEFVTLGYRMGRSIDRSNAH